MIVSITRRWFGMSEGNAREACRQARIGFHKVLHGASRSNLAPIDLLFPQGIQCRRVPVKRFLVGLMAVKMADSVIDERERDALLDVISLMPSKKIPSFGAMRREAQDLLRLHLIMLGKESKAP